MCRVTPIYFPTLHTNRLFALQSHALRKRSFKISPNRKRGGNAKQIFRIWYWSHSSACFVRKKLISWEPTCDVKLFENLASWRIDFTVYVQPSLSKGGEALHKFLKFDTKSNILHENKIGTALESFTI